MNDATIEATTDSIYEFLVSMHNAIADDSKLIDDTPEAVIARARSVMIERFSIYKDKRTLDQLFKLQDMDCRSMIMQFASQPSIAVEDSGPHLLFADAWMRIAVAKLLATKGQVDNALKVAFVCCSTLAQWSKTGYRLDWHPLHAELNRSDPSAPVGSWTKEWAKDRQVGLPERPPPPPAQPAASSAAAQASSKIPGTKPWWAFWK